MQTNAEYERLRTDDSDVPGPVMGDNPRWLNSADAISEIVRDFTADFLRKYGVIEQQRLMAWLSNECVRMNALFIGEGLQTMPYRRGPWNTPDFLGMHLAIGMGITGELRFAVRDAWMMYAAQLGQIVRDHQEEDQGDALNAALADAVSAFATRLLGTDEVSR